MSGRVWTQSMVILAMILGVITSRADEQVSGADRYKVHNLFGSSTSSQQEGDLSAIFSSRQALLGEVGFYGQDPGPQSNTEVRPPEIELQQIQNQESSPQDQNSSHITRDYLNSTSQAGIAGPNPNQSDGRVTGKNALLPYLRNYRSDSGRSYKDNGRNSNVPGAPNTDIGQGGDTYGTSGDPIDIGP